MAKFKIGATVAAFVLTCTPQLSLAADNDLPWEPSGQVTMMIGFNAGGGADSLARMLAEGLNSRFGWNVVPENVPGRGGAAMNEALKDEPADGLAIGVTVSQSLTYDPQVAMTPTFELDDFDYLSSLTGSQVGIVARADRGWSTLGDVIEAAKSGEDITFASITQKFSDGTYVIGKRNGVEFTSVNAEGGRGGLNAVMADDVDIAWVGGAQASSVLSGDVVNIASGEEAALQVSPDAPLLTEYDVPYTFGVKFMVIAPAGLPEDVKTTYMTAISELLNDPESQLAQLTVKGFSGPDLVQGDALRADIDARYAEAAALIEDAGQ
ncbi:tripartite tricarboxylate transporter substrate-binding protein [Alloyangia pacifica]|uniref:Tripartite-type tricarboxylate transporter, receptor component TctC n=1 Tax=Alloyangia pacifica TaxID=311180 RepID=A0A1I6VJ46_9RHOB|nr:tripartite tricarboxylate transporter substrate-binding protein [Alloyangia pacifica]SDI00407.1 Tripartite-type tricarboxylate transporter, receptor component TctC [Alloyangia pacifica]SFT13667.1 Tripartite-type tricarboxylate transporter, receptor component TctC [Alloyangia pacifica]